MENVFLSITQICFFLILAPLVQGIIKKTKALKNLSKKERKQQQNAMDTKSQQNRKKRQEKKTNCICERLRKNI